MMLPKNICFWLFWLCTIMSMGFASATMNNNSTLPISVLDLACNSQDDVFSPMIVDELLGPLLVAAAAASEPNLLFECDEIAKGLQATSPSYSLLETNATMAPLIQHFQETSATGLSLELWIQPSDRTNNPQDLRSLPIFTIGSSQEFSSPDIVGCNGYELQVAQRGDLLEVSYADNDAAQSCRVLVVRAKPLVPGKLVQILLIWSAASSETSIYFDGEPILTGARNSFDASLSTWNPDYKLQLFSNHVSDHYVFEGTIHYVAIYDEPMDVLAIASAYQEGLDRLEEIHNQPVVLVASSEKRIDLVQGQGLATTKGETSFTIGGFNASTPSYDVWVEVTTLPLFGNLRTVEGLINAPGYRIPLVGSSTFTSLFYQAWSKEYFNVPSSTFSGARLDLPTEAFTYRLVAMRGNEQLGVSDPVTQRLHIVHVNQAPTLQAPLSATESEEQPFGIGARPSAVVEGLEIMDVNDRNIDRIRVDVWTWNGTLTIADEYRDLADFDSCADRAYSSWQCHGGGRGGSDAERNFTFVAEPDAVALILDNLQYTAFYWDTSDEIVVRIFDGSGGPCLDEQEHQKRFFSTTDDLLHPYYTIHEQCNQATATIIVPQMRKPSTGSFKDEGFFKSLFDLENFGIPDVVFWSCVGIIICCGCFCFSACMKIRGRRGAKIYPEQAPNVHVQPSLSAENV
jgi:hypothetical protein